MGSHALTWDFTRYLRRSNGALMLKEAILPSTLYCHLHGATHSLVSSLKLIRCFAEMFRSVDFKNEWVSERVCVHFALLWLGVLLMKPHTSCVLSFLKYILPVSFFNTFCSIILLLVIDRLHKTVHQFDRGKTITYRAEGPWGKAESQPHRFLCLTSLHILYPNLCLPLFTSLIH